MSSPANNNVPASAPLTAGERKPVYQVTIAPDGTQTKRQIGFEQTPTRESKEAARLAHLHKWRKGGEMDLERKATLRRAIEKHRTGGGLLDADEMNAVVESHQALWEDAVFQKLRDGAPLYQNEADYIKRCGDLCAYAGPKAPQATMDEMVAELAKQDSEGM